MNARSQPPTPSGGRGRKYSPKSYSSSPQPATPPPKAVSFRFYQPPQNTAADPDSDTYSSDEGSTSGRGSSQTKGSGSRRAGACIHCKSLKVKCHFPSGQTTCQRCRIGGFDCSVYGRKKRRAVPTHEDLVEKSHRQDMEIVALLQRMDNMRTEARIEEWLGKANPQSYPSPRSSDSGRDSLLSTGSTPGYLQHGGYPHMPHTDFEYIHMQHTNNRSVSTQELLPYFPDTSGADPRSLKAPDILTSGLIAPTEVFTLFETFFEVVNPYFSVLDPELHTPEKLIWKSHFLFTAICAISSHYYGRPGLYKAAIEFARDAAGKALTEGSKTVDACQAFLLIAMFPVPRKRYVQDRSWIFMGVAFRLALELRLCTPSPNITNERERLNRARTWFNCFITDVSHAILFGKQPMLSLDDYTTRTSKEWYRSSKYNMPSDVHLVAQVDLLRLLGRFQAEIRDPSLSSVADYLNISTRYNKQFSQLRDEWLGRFAANQISDSYMSAYRVDCFRMINAYTRLIVLSSGFQKAVKSSVSSKDYIVHASIATAQEVIDIMMGSLYPTGLLKYSPEAHFIYVAFAAAFLLNLLTPKLRVLLTPEMPRSIETMIMKLVMVLQDRTVSLDNKHTPHLYSRFLLAFLNRHTNLTPQDRFALSQQFSQRPSEDTKAAASHPTLWMQQAPTMASMDPSGQIPSRRTSQQSVDPCAYQLSVPEMDLSVNHFVESMAGFTGSTMPSPPPGEDPQQWWTDVYMSGNHPLTDSFKWPLATNGSY